MECAEDQLVDDEEGFHIQEEANNGHECDDEETLQKTGPISAFYRASHRRNFPAK